MEWYISVNARDNFAVAFVMDNALVYGSIKRYVKVAEDCGNVQCTERNSHCEYDVNYFAIIEVLEKHPRQLCMLVNGRRLLKHMVRVLPTNRLVAVAVNAIREKCVWVDVSSGTWVCHLPNNIMKD